MTLACAMVLGVALSDARAGSVAIYVGYADDIRPNAYFPDPWQGSPNTIFLGAPSYDGGAVLIDNTASTPINVDSLVVSGFSNGAVFNLWGKPGVLPAGDYMILTGYGENFDTSDQLSGFAYPDSPGSGFTPGHPYTGDPKLALTLNGTLFTFSDTGHILDTGGYDTATFPLSTFPNNESLQWRPIGTTGINDPAGQPPGTPEPGSLVLAGIGGAGLLAYRLRRRRRDR